MTTETRKNVEPWEMQRELMAASGQKLPGDYNYMVQPGVILYAALNMEEMSEGLRGLRNAIDKNLGAHPALKEIEAHLVDTYLRLHTNSLAIRELVKKLPADLELPVTRKDLREMADGATDLTVTNAGFALSLGLPAAALYDEVASSNLSKKNPETGVIDKTPDGKWIKGVAYREPNIDAVLHPPGHERVDVKV